jgi:predicted naringenin-chalcone synthase
MNHTTASASTPALGQIVAISLATPAHCMEQQSIFDTIYRPAFRAPPGPGCAQPAPRGGQENLGRPGVSLRDVENAERLFANVGVARRHAFYNPALSTLDADAATRLPTSERMKLWKQGALEIGRQALQDIFQHIEPAAVGSYVMVSSTGSDGQPPDMLLAKEFGLRPNLRRTVVGHMGCQAAFNGLKVALDALQARPQEAVLLHCTEISSAHVRTSECSTEQIIAQALFADASVAMALVSSPQRLGPAVLHTHTEILYEHIDKLNLSVGDDGFRMTISPRVAAVIGGAVSGFVERMLAPLRMQPSDVEHWGIHPGGPQIVEQAATALRLPRQATRTSLDILAEYGNCASPTILLILDRLLRAEQPRPGSIGVLLAFGPGLTIEGAVLRF